MCRQYSRPRNLHGPDIHRNRLLQSLEVLFVNMENSLVKSRPGRQLQIREIVFGVVCMGQCKPEKDSMLLLYFFWPQLNKENML